jgi:hypothetical protein
MARCQEIDADDQIKLGARWFDIRLRFTRKGQIRFCHGKMEYDLTVDELKKFLKKLNDSNKEYYVRVVLETKKADEWQEKCFRAICSTLLMFYPNIKFFGGNNRTDWLCEHPIFKFEEPLPLMINAYSSATTLFPDGKRWLKFIDDLYPKFYAKKMNAKNKADYNDKHLEDQNVWLIMDFINIG